MNQEVKKKWLEALRSGEYKQCRGDLQNREGEYCCLGVLCDLHAKETGNTWVGLGGATTGLRYLDSGDVLPETVYDWAGLPVYTSKDGTHEKLFAVRIKEGAALDAVIPRYVSLISLNDIFKKSFAEIADVIEKEL